MNSDVMWIAPVYIQRWIIGANIRNDLTIKGLCNSKLKIKNAVSEYMLKRTDKRYFIMSKTMRINTIVEFPAPNTRTQR
jgi:hypothetical protein